MNLARLFRFPPALSDDLKSNFIYYFWDIAWWAFYTGSTATFLTIYAARSGATPEQIGWLTALPALLTLALSLPAGRFLKRYPAKWATVWSCFAQRILFLVYALLPWLLPGKLQVSALLVLAAIIAVPTTVIGISFTQLIIEAIPSQWRGTVVGTRNMILSVISLPVTMLSGQILTRMVFPTGYQVVFMIGFVGAILTVYQLAHVKPVADPSVPQLSAVLTPARFPLPPLDFAGRGYLKVIGLLFLFNMTNNMLAPLIPNLLVHTLNLSDATISIGTATSSMLVFIVSLFIARLTRRTGNRRATALGAALLAFQAVALALARDATLYLAAAVIGGFAAGILNVAQYNYHLDNVPRAEQSTWLSWNLMLGNSAVLLGALIGPAVAQINGTPSALVFFGILRFVVGLIILKWG